MTKLKLLRPEPMVDCGARTVDRSLPPSGWARLLMAGESLVVTDHYRTGDVVLRALAELMPEPVLQAPFADRVAHKAALRAAGLRLLAPIRGGRMAMIEGSRTPLLRELYPELDAFWLPFMQVQELHGAWERYVEGSKLAVLGRTLHPYYGVYAPTRTSHLELFGTWLSQYGGSRGVAIDVGTGCGVLALMLARAGFSSVLATDTNPNAVHSVRLDVARAPVVAGVRAVEADLLGGGAGAVDLVVFNPPWIRGPVNGLLDAALYFEDGLFERFFDQVHARLAPEGRVALVFSNVNELVQPDAEHPIQAELDRGRFRLVQKLQRRAKPAGGAHKRSRERVEVWELARGSEG